MEYGVIEKRVIAGEIELYWDDLRSEEERQGLTGFTAEVLDGKVELLEDASISITTHEYYH